MNQNGGIVSFRKNVILFRTFPAIALWISFSLSGFQAAAEKVDRVSGANQSAASPETAISLNVAEVRFAHGLAMHGAPALPPGFVSLPYADPDAPQGGRATYGETGGFDAMNPYIVRGRTPWALRDLVFESLLERSFDEPFTLYGLLAEGVFTPPDRSSVTFLLRAEARFSDGSPVTVEDVVWSMETLRDKGLPSFRNMYGQVARVERIGDRGVRFVFAKPNRELPLLMGMMPIFSKAAWSTRDFARGDLTPPIASGPYQVVDVDPGRRVLFRKNPDYWGASLAINRGRNNFEEIELIFFRDQAARWEAFTSGGIDFYYDYDPANWAEAYDFPAAAEGLVVRGEIPHGLPSGLRGFVFNLRRPPFDDRRVREAFALAFDFKWMNDRFYRGAYERILSYFSGSHLGHDGAATGEERRLLTPFASSLPEGALDARWSPPMGAGDGRNRSNLRKARRLLAEAGWRFDGGVLRNGDGAPFRFEILVRATEDERVAQAFVDMLDPLGVGAAVRFVDAAQYQERRTDFDYDMILHGWYASLSPGEEQRQYWGSDFANAPGSRNYMGVEAPAIDAMIDAMLAAENEADFQSATRALDRVLANGVYVIPLGYLTTHRVAWRRGFDKPDVAPLYGNRRDVWWRQPE